eukprot:14480746-Alexandrium_andersonii.AAC.1
MGPAVVAERKRNAKVHLEFMAKIYLSQLERGGRFLHERPMAASSWDEDCIKRLMARPEVQCGVGHTRRFGMAVLAPTRTGAAS